MPGSINHRRSPHLFPWYQALWRCGRIVLLCGLLVLTAAAGGCQRRPAWKLASVEGTVTKGGRPLRGIEVVFVTDLDAGTQGPRASGTTDEAGHYHLRTDNGNDGAVVGKHRVLVIDLEAVQKRLFARASRGPQRKDTARLSPEIAKRLEEQQKQAVDTPRVPLSYEHFNETPLRAEVGHEPLTFDIIIP
jgi:hypothetical protein